ncbi:hypothetical protein INT48_005849 [Thamnidium elegans]|uniref:Zn(2)-C6 fungal-type domain-containing protein n=1 Tax=Thamnidium elegans TaxID=101142 RepID=A0A8H7VU17_9FUNG|nr:hypothetical protein INT48_005849 [Thamnidium elegans]
MTQRKKKTIEYHFVDMNDPDRYKKLKVARACDFCRRRKSKCDIGIPGSGTCSNCKKANHICIFSPTNASIVPTSVPTIQQQQQENGNNTFIYQYQNKFSFFSMNQKAHCGFEKDEVYSNALFLTMDQLPVYSTQFEHELFQVYFTHVHPFFPILDKYGILQSLGFDSLPCSLRWAVIAITISDFSNINKYDSNQYYQHALHKLDHTSTLYTVQTLLLLYKYQELNTPVGIPLSSAAIGHLKQAQSILSQWIPKDEFVCRAKWILFIILSMSNPADKRINNTLDYYFPPNNLPALTDTEQYDEVDINTTVWKRTLPEHIARFFNEDASILYATQSHIPKSTSFIAYLCLIHDILDLLISANQPNQHDLSKMAYSVCFRAHNFTVADLQPARFSCLASIKGSRIVSFGLTLALQAQAYHDRNKETEKFSICFSIAYQIFDQIYLSPQLYMTIQAFQTQTQSKKQLEQYRDYTLNNNTDIHGRLDSNSSSSGSGNSSNDTTSNYYNTVTTTATTNQSSTQQTNESNGWQNYNNSYSTNNNNFQSSWSNSMYYSSPQEDMYSMPITPTFEPTEINQLDINTPSSFSTVDSYFQPQVNVFEPSVTVSMGPYDFINSYPIERSYKSKSCNTRPTA